jgi:hypothetical protein
MFLMFQRKFLPPPSVSIVCSRIKYSGNIGMALSDPLQGEGATGAMGAVNKEL